jgi:perosamine synthetase
MIHHSRPTITEEDIGAVKEILLSLQIGQGSQVEFFERELAGFIGKRYALAVNSGTSALHLALLSLGVGKGDEVILPSYLCTSVLNAVNYTGAKPVLADIELNNLCISLSDTKKKMTKKTKAIIVVHTFGAPADIDEFCKFGISIIEDCATSIGAECAGRKTGSFGTISIFSFYATKVITTGFGGMALTDSEELYNKMLDLREFDGRTDYKVRYNYKMSDIEAALGRSQLKRLPNFIKKRRKIAGFYTERLKGRFKTPETPGHIFYRYILLTERRDYFAERLKEAGIETKPPVYKPLHSYLGIDGFPNTEKVQAEGLSLPIYPSLSDEEAERVLEVLLG